jgi:hypothetical protein
MYAPKPNNKRVDAIQALNPGKSVTKHSPLVTGRHFHSQSVTFVPDFKNAF